MIVLEAVVIIAASVAVTANAVVLTWIGIKIRKMAARRGYRGPTVPILVGTVGFVTFFFSFAGATTAVDEHWPAAGVAALLGLPDLVVAGCAGLVALLPRRKKPAGPRRSRFPFQSLGRLAGAGAVLAVLAGLVVGIASGAWSVVRVGLTAALVATMCFSFARRQRLARTDPVAGEDTRSPVVYLRHFRQETEIFSEEGSRVDWSGLRRWAGVFYGRPEEVFLSFERFIEGAVKRHLGPFVALGSPRDYLPPEGAGRIYAGQEWEEEVRALIDRAGCILTVVTTVSDSKALTFEYCYMLEEGAVDRLFVVTSPYGPTRPPPRRLRIGNRLQGSTPTPWGRFAADLNELRYNGLHYKMPIDPPAPGTVVGFDKQGRAVEVTTGARTPDDYIIPIARRLAGGQHAGD